MLIYNSNKEFIGIDEKDLKTLGFSNLAQLKAEAEDFADLFMRTTGYVHNFQHVHWIDFVECADASQDSKVIIKVNNVSFEANLSIEVIYLSNQPSSKAYTVHLHQLRRLGGAIPAMPALEHAPEPTIKQEKLTSLREPTPTLMETTPSYDHQSLDIDLEDEDDVFMTPSPETKKSPIVEEEEKYEDDGYVFDPQVASEQLGLPIDLIEEFIQDFIAQAKEFKGELYDSLANEDIANVATLSHKLKGVAANLRIEDALNTLTIVNEARDLHTIKSNLKHFYKIIARLSGEETEGVKEPSVSEEEELILDFKEEPLVEIQSEIREEIAVVPEAQEEDLILELDEDVFTTESPSVVITEEDKLSLDFKDDEEDGSEEILEIHDEDVPEKIEMPELEDDDFLSLDIIENVVTEPEEKLFFEEEIIEEEVVVNYPREMIANSIGLDMETFDEILDDYVTDMKALSLEIHEALQNNDLEKCSKNAVMIKGMSESIHMKAFDPQIESLIQAIDIETMKQAINTIDKIINKISNKV